MKVNRPTLRSQLLFAGIALGVLVSAGYADAASTLTHHFDSETLDLRHLIGEVRVEQHGGSGFEVEVQVAGRDARDGMIELRTEANRLDVLFPGGHSDFIYPALGRGSTSSIEIGHDKGELFHGPGGAGRLRVRGQGDGLELWADVVVRVPSGGRLEVDHAIGAIRVEGVDAELELATDSGRIEVHDSSGEIAAATGSGEIELVRTDGKHVGLATGSGTIRIESSSGDTYEVGAGSGNVSISGLVAREVEIGTGSGNLRAEGIEADRAEFGTGSGEIEVSLVPASRGDYELGAGSGNVRLEFVGGADAVVHAETSSGKIDVSVGGATFHKQKKDEVEFTLGSGGARVDIGTGSGDIRING